MYLCHRDIKSKYELYDKISTLQPKVSNSNNSSNKNSYLENFVNNLKKGRGPEVSKVIKQYKDACEKTMKLGNNITILRGNMESIQKQKEKRYNLFSAKDNGDKAIANAKSAINNASAECIRLKTSIIVPFASHIRNAIIKDYDAFVSKYGAYSNGIKTSISEISPNSHIDAYYNMKSESVHKENVIKDVVRSVVGDDKTKWYDSESNNGNGIVKIGLSNAMN